MILRSLFPSAPYLATSHLSLHRIPSYFAFPIVVVKVIVLTEIVTLELSFQTKLSVGYAMNDLQYDDIVLT